MTDAQPPLSLWGHSKSRRVTMKDVIERVAEKYGIEVDDIKGPNRARRFAWPRQEFCYEAHLIGRSYPQIGAFCGGRDHTTALHGKRRHEARLEAAMGANRREDEAA